jgi:hypothetical protein
MKVFFIMTRFLILLSIATIAGMIFLQYIDVMLLALAIDQTYALSSILLFHQIDDRLILQKSTELWCKNYLLLSLRFTSSIDRDLSHNYLTSLPSLLFDNLLQLRNMFGSVFYCQSLSRKLWINWILVSVIIALYTYCLDLSKYQNLRSASLFHFTWLALNPFRVLGNNQLTSLPDLIFSSLIRLRTVFVSIMHWDRWRLIGRRNTLDFERWT